ncbi:hypothetical protein DFH11DRAFT_488714 [Phellopilus nigrolimitatus]|nr:hypothetical protein DFH11DRAFT_488714 [Phellopilus nigrolimitatus]
MYSGRPQSGPRELGKPRDGELWMVGPRESDVRIQVARFLLPALWCGGGGAAVCERSGGKSEACPAIHVYAIRQKSGTDEAWADRAGAPGAKNPVRNVVFTSLAAGRHGRTRGRGRRELLTQSACIYLLSALRRLSLALLASALRCPAVWPDARALSGSFLALHMYACCRFAVALRRASRGSRVLSRSEKGGVASHVIIAVQFAYN